VCVLRVCVYECAGSLAFTTNTPRCSFLLSLLDVVAEQSTQI
jgi:hypothetical protein